MSFSPNDDNKDNTILDALDNATTLSQVGILGFLRSDRFAYLQKPILPLDTYKNSISMRFDEGTFGWNFVYAVSPDPTIKSGILAVIFRYPTKSMSTDKDSYYSVTGYIIENNQTKPFSTIGSPIICTGDYSSTSDTVTLKLNFDSCKNDNNIFLQNMTFTGSSFLQKTNFSVTFTNNQTYSLNLNTTNDASMQGDDTGCTPCIDGVGTNYWSFTYMTGTLSNSLTTQNTPVIGWFDNQWGALSFAPRSWFTRFLGNLSGFFKPPSYIRWFWITVQLSSDVQYVLTMFPDSIVKKGDTFTNNTNNKYEIDSNGKTTITRNIQASIELLEMSPYDDKLPYKIKVNIDNKIFILNSIGDGRITLIDGSVNTETPCLLYDSNNKIIPGAVGFIEGNKLHDANDDLNHMKELAGISDNVSLDIFLPKKLTFAQSWSSLLLAFTFLLSLLSLIIFIIVKIVKYIRKRQQKVYPQ
jgi:hypothetical protein